MARLTAGLVWAAVLRFVVLGVGLSRGSGGQIVSLLPGATRTPVKIFCKENPNLNVAISGNVVVLAQANPDDESQARLTYRFFFKKRTLQIDHSLQFILQLPVLINCQCCMYIYIAMGPGLQLRDR